jgi:quinoprotein glucose dehydrogenase
MTTAQNTTKSLPIRDSSNFFDFTQITKENVSQLEVAWHYPYGGSVFSPVYANDVVYGFGRNNNAIMAIDATTGQELWVHDGLSGIQNKGMNYWESADGRDRRLLFSVDSFLQAIDARTGKSILTFGDDGHVDLRKGLLRAEGTSLRVMPASPGRIYRNTLILGGQAGEGTASPPGDIRAYDVLTGKLLWQFHTVPRPGEFGYSSNPPDGWKYMGGANNWGEMSIDERRGIVYFPTGSATADFYGGDRHGNNLFANSLLALNVRNGRRVWHYQMVHHDLWDFDGVSAPQLVTIRQNGRNVDVVAHAGKTGFLYVFNRENGRPIWPIEERPVPKGDVPGEWYSPTQPFPTKPAPFGKQSFTEADVNPWLLTPEQQAEVKERVRNAVNGQGPQGGIFVPTKVNADAISMPGNQGGSNWGTAASDPSRGLVFVTNVNQVALLRLNDVKTPPEPTGRGGGGGGGATPETPMLARGRQLYAEFCVSCHATTQLGARPGVPSIVGVTGRLDDEQLRRAITERPAHTAFLLRLNTDDLSGLATFLAATGPVAGRGAAPAGGRGRIGGGPPLPPPTNLAGTGGAPRPPLPARYGGPYYPGVGGTAGNMPWPEDVAAAKLPTRYQSGYNVMATATAPPYTTITAYDLNTGDIKWQVPNGDDPDTIAAGGPANTGGLAARNGMVVTRTGLLFQLSKDGFVRAYDVDTGQVLWKGKAAGQAIGIPTMYMSKGRQYLVVMSPLPTTAEPGTATIPYGYIAYALPQK